MKMRTKPLKGTVSRLKRRAGVMPTKVETNRAKALPRRAKHKRQDNDKI